MEMSSPQTAVDAQSIGSKHDTVNSMPELALESVVGMAALTELERRMYEHSVGLRASPSIKELLHELSRERKSQSSGDTLEQSALDVARQTCSWVSEMQNVEETIEKALCEEAFEEGTEPESEHPSSTDAMDARLAQLQDAVRLQIVAPLLKAFGDARELAGTRLMIPAFSYDILTILAKTWHLARVRGLHVQRLESNMARLQAETQKAMEARLKEEANMASAAKVKKVLKEKSWELSRAQARIEQLESDRLSTEQQLLQLERAKQREASCREEAERRLSSLQADNRRQLSEIKELSRAQARIEQLESDRSDSEQQLLQLERAKQQEASCREEGERRLRSLQADNRRRLSEIKDALVQVKEALTDARDGRQHAAELEAALKKCHQQLEEVEQQRQQRQQTRQQHENGEAGSGKYGCARSLSESHLSNLPSCRRGDVICSPREAALQVKVSSSRCSRTATPMSYRCSRTATPMSHGCSAASFCVTPGMPPRRFVKQTNPEPLVASALPINLSSHRCDVKPPVPWLRKTTRTFKAFSGSPKASNNLESIGSCPFKALH